MHSIQHKIDKNFKKSVTLQIIFVATLLTIALFATNGYLAFKHHIHAKEDFSTIYGQIAHEKSSNLYQKFNLLGTISLSLATQASEILAHPNRYDSSIFLIRDENTTRNRLADNRFTLYTQNDLNANTRLKAQKASLLLPLLESTVKNSEDIENGWIHIDEPLTLIYPPRSSTLNLVHFDPLTDEQFNLFLANPRAQWRFLLADNDKIKITAPIFVNNTLAGITGFDLNIDLFSSAIKEIKLPAGASLVLIDTVQKRVIAGTDKTLSVESLLDESSDAITISSKVGNLPLMVAVTISSSALDNIGYENYKETLIASAIVVALVLIFYIVFLINARNKIASLAKSFTKPLDEIVRFSHHIGLQNNRRLEPTGIVDLDDLSNHLHLAHSRLISLLIVDELTGTYNRRKLLLDLESNGTFGLITMNINRFKYLNDTYGYSAGDYVLKRIVELLKDMECDGCEVYRIAGDEFAVLLPTNDINLLKIHADNIVASVGNSLFLFNEIEMEISLSVGVASGEIKDGAKLLSKADVALSRSREVRQLPVMIYSHSLEAEKKYESSLYWEKRIKDAIRSGSLMPWFQPIMEIATSKIIKFEALVRIVDKNEAIPPYFFLEAAKKTGALYDIAKRVIDKSFEAASMLDGIEFSINLALSDLEHPELTNFIEERANHYKIDRSLITFEMLETESLQMADSPVRNTVIRLKELGYKIAIDDFGSGYSNFARFIDLDVDYIKIDGQFIRNIHRDENSQHALKAILEFASATKAKTVAEYVETRHIYEALKSYTIDYAQGFFISKAVPLEKAKELIRR